MVMETTALMGMKEIAGFLRRSESTVLDVYIRQLAAPITKIGGRWESDVVLLEEWRREMIRRGVRL